MMWPERRRRIHPADRSTGLLFVQSQVLEVGACYRTVSFTHDARGTASRAATEQVIIATRLDF